MENHAKESIKHKVVLPNSKTINIEGTKFKYEIHYDQLNEKDLLTIEKYANHIFHAYQEKYGLDMNTDHTFRGFIYNNLADLRNAHLRYDVAYAQADFHHYPHNSGAVAYDLTQMIYFTLSLYNKGKHGVPPNENHFIGNVTKELKTIKLDDNQEKQNTAEKPETTINQKESKKVEPSDPEAISTETVLPDLNNSDNNQEESNTEKKPETTIYQEESKKVEPSSSGEKEKSKVEGEKSCQEEISPETILLNSKTINIEGTKFKYEIHYDQLDDKDLLRIEKYANYIFHAYQERYGLDISTDYTFKGFIYNNFADLCHDAFATMDNHHIPNTSESIARYLVEGIYLTLNLYKMEKHGTPDYRYPGSTFIKDVEKELKDIRLDDNQEEPNTEETTMNQEKELEEQDVLTTTDHPLDDYNHDYHLIG